jgi:hypothetical protein
VELDSNQATERTRSSTTKVRMYEEQTNRHFFYPGSSDRVG